MYSGKEKSKFQINFKSQISSKLQALKSDSGFRQNDEEESG